MEYGGFTLDTFQERAIASIDRGRSVIVAAPTGAGKTLIAEYAFEQAMERNRQIIYTAPIKALSNQKFRDFSAKYPERIGILTGDVTINYNAPGLLMTTEILRNTLLEDPGRLAGVDHVIFDEFHYINDIERGTVWEESVIFSPERISFICLSATMPNISEIAGWMREVHANPVDVIVERKRPIPLDHSLWVDGYGVYSLEAFERLMKEIAGGRPPKRRFPVGSGPLLAHIVEQRMLPCLNFCFNRRRCEEKAVEAADSVLLTAAESRRAAATFRELGERFGVMGEPSARHMGDLVRRGVAYHHAGILPTIKEVIERMFSLGLIKVLFTTETFALGINMPAQTVVLDSLEKFHGTHFGILRAREYQQMAGRAGRRGMDDRGFVFARVDPEEVSVKDVKLVVAGKAERIESQFNLSYATLLSLYDRVGKKLFDVCERSFMVYQQKQKGGKGNLGAPLRRQIQSRLDVLRHMGFIGKTGLLDRGRFALHVPGYELALTELYYEGAFEELSPHEVNVLLSALVHESRPGERRIPLPHHLLRKRGKRSMRLVEQIADIERLFRVDNPIRKLDFRLGAAVDAWSHGADFASLRRLTPAPEGDIIRSLRMMIQLLRQMRRAGVDTRMSVKLGEAENAVNRGAVNAEHQLRAGCIASAESPKDMSPGGTPTTE